MNDDRKRVPLASGYAFALGTVTYCFARCEWDVVWCCERIQPGALRRMAQLRAGAIAIRFENLIKRMPSSPERQELQTLAGRFTQLVKIRNGILHGKPCTAPRGEQRLSSGAILEVADLERSADDFTECSSGLNSLLHGFLSTFAGLPPQAGPNPAGTR